MCSDEHQFRAKIKIQGEYLSSYRVTSGLNEKDGTFATAHFHV